MNLIWVLKRRHTVGCNSRVVLLAFEARMAKRQLSKWHGILANVTLT